jgi:membrane associated rhomboid family serine protease
MFFPIGDQNITKATKPFFTYSLIAVNVVVFIIQFTLPEGLQNSFMFTYGSIPNEVTKGTDLYTLFTCMFLHGGWMHLIGNMMFLWVFGDNIEATIGSIKFFLFYIFAGIVASLTHSLLSPLSNVPCVGASGAIAGVLGAYLMMFPKSQIKVLFIVLLRTFTVPAIYFLGFWIVQQFMSGLGTLNVTSSANTGVAYWAHIGGFVFGVVAGFLLRKKAQLLSLS